MKDRVAEILRTPMQQLPIVLRKLLADAGKVQEDTLLDILERAGDTEYGRNYGFSEIHTVRDYQERVPVTEYPAYLEAVERLKKGEADLLFQGKAHSFLATSGSTGIPKYIPESQAGYDVKAAVGNFRTVEMLRMAPEVMAPDAKILAITNPAEYEETEGGIPVGSASGQAAESTAMAEKFALPPQLLRMKGLPQPDMDHLTILFALAEQNLAAIVCNNLAHFHILLERLYRDHKAILGDMQRGTISLAIDGEDREALEKALQGRRERAEELLALFAGNVQPSVKELWPRLTAVGCWLSGSVGRVAQDVKKDFPEETKYLDWGYGASEGKFNIPVDMGSPAGVPAVFGYFFEFLPVGGDTPVLLSETEAGRVYELIVTSYSGFYRYNIHDAVIIGKSREGFPTIEFVGKTAENMETPKGTFYSYQLTGMIGEYEKEKQVFLRLYQLRREEGGVVLTAEPGSARFPKEDFEGWLGKTLQKEKGLFLKRIEWQEEGYRDSLFTRALKPGKTVNQTKLAIFV